MVQSQAGLEAPVLRLMETHELGTHGFAGKTRAFGGKTRARPSNRRHVKARTIECCRTLSRTNHVLVTYPQRRPERGAGPKSTQAGILSVDV